MPATAKWKKDHGRIETRHCIASDILTRSLQPAIWPGMRSIVMVEATREIGDTLTTERRYYMSSLPPDAQRIAHAVRSHWRVENNLHWCLDVAFGEDHCHVRVDNAARNFAILRRIVMNLLRHDLKTKAGLKTRRLKAATSDLYHEQILGGKASEDLTFHAIALSKRISPARTDLRNRHNRTANLFDVDLMVVMRQKAIGCAHRRYVHRRQRTQQAHQR